MCLLRAPIAYLLAKELFACFILSDPSRSPAEDSVHRLLRPETVGLGAASCASQRPWSIRAELQGQLCLTRSPREAGAGAPLSGRAMPPVGDTGWTAGGLRPLLAEPTGGLFPALRLACVTSSASVTPGRAGSGGGPCSRAHAYRTLPKPAAGLLSPDSTRKQEEGQWPWEWGQWDSRGL